jgi:hypothetical protein
MAAQTLVSIAGTVTNVTIWQPREGNTGKPCLKIDLLQISEAGSNIETIKDENLNGKYVVGQSVTLVCTASPWQFNKSNGVSFKVYRGETKSISLNVAGGSPSVDSLCEPVESEKQTKDQKKGLI